MIRLEGDKTHIKTNAHGSTEIAEVEFMTDASFKAWVPQNSEHRALEENGHKVFDAPRQALSRRNNVCSRARRWCNICLKAQVCKQYGNSYSTVIH